MTNAREIALAKIKEKIDKEIEATRTKKENEKFIKAKGKQLYKVVDDVLSPFEQDFSIKQRKAKKDNSYGWYLWEFGKNPKSVLFYVVLSYETHKARFSDDTAEQEWQQWTVNVMVPSELYNWRFKPYYHCEGKFSFIAQCSVVNDFSCTGITEKLEQQFGEYMVKWY